MRSQSLFAFLFALSGATTFAQPDVKIWTEKSKVGAIVEFERAINEDLNILGKNVSVSKSTFPYVEEYELGNPLIIERASSNNLPIYAEYFFSKPDSLVRFISYNWEIDRYGNYDDKKEVWKREAKKLDLYNQKYHDIKVVLIDKLGTPSEQDFEPQRTKSQWDDSYYWSRRTTWENELIISSLSLVFAANTYRIRWNYYWKK